MRNYLSVLLCAVALGLLQACGGGGQEDPVAAAPAEQAAISTRFNISVDVPIGVNTAYQSTTGIINSAYADALTSLSENNFVIVLLDAEGKIYRQADITHWEEDPVGTYIIDADTLTRFNAVVLVSRFNTPDFTLGEALPDNVFVAPLLSTDVAVTLNSTLAYFSVAQKVVNDEDWGIFSEVVSKPGFIELRTATEMFDEIGTELNNILVSQIGLRGITIEQMMSLTLVKAMTSGLIERKYTEQTSAISDVEAILKEGFWQLKSQASNDGNNINADHTSYDGQESITAQYKWDRNDDADIALNEYFTYFSGTTAFSDNDITEQILTTEGWVGLYDYLQVLFITPRTAILTNAALNNNDDKGLTLEVNAYPLTDKTMYDYLATEDNHRLTKYIKEDAVFEDGAYGFYFTWKPQTDQHLLCNNRNDVADCRIAPVIAPLLYYTNLDDIFTNQPSETFLNVNGFKISDNVVAEFISNDFNTVLYWYNVAGDNWQVQAEGTWGSVNTFGKELIRFEVPNLIAQLDASYDFNTRQLFLVNDKNYINIGETLLDGDKSHFSAFNVAAKEQIFALATRSNLPAFGLCNYGNTSNANGDKYLNAVIECGGDDRFNTQNISELIDQHIVQITPDGEISTIILKEDNNWEFYNNSVKDDISRAWSLTDDGYLRLDWVSPASDDNFDYWARTSRALNDKLHVVKAYSINDDGVGSPSETIYPKIVKEYAPDQLLACDTNDSGWSFDTIAPITKQSLTQYTTQTAACLVSWDQRTTRFTENMLLNDAGVTGDDLALTFASDTSRYLKLTDNFDGDYFKGSYGDTDGCGFNFEIRWRIEEDGTLYYQALDGSMNERIKITESDGLRFAIKAFNHQTRWQSDEALMYTTQEGEMWSDIVTLVRADDIPEAVIIPPPPPPEPEVPSEGETPVDPPAEPEAPAGPAKGTILNDGQTCEYLNQA
jgi:hypothetical protein